MKKCNIENCDKPHYAKGFCKNHYSQNLWKTNDKYRERSQKHNSDNWHKNKTKNNQTQQIYYHNVIKFDPKIMENRRSYGRKYSKTHRLEQNTNRRKWRKENPEKAIQENRSWTNKVIKSMKKWSWSRQHINFSINYWSKAVRKRDKNCVICGSNEDLVAHHIFEKAILPELCLNLNNGVTLCRKHHLEVHGLKIIIKQT